VAEGARLESVFRGNSNVGSNPTLSASFSVRSLIELSQVHTAVIPTLRKQREEVYFRHAFADRNSGNRGADCGGRPRS
jgi:hypothetical protein